MGTPNWKDGYRLPFESDWGLLHKKCFLDGCSIHSGKAWLRNTDYSDYFYTDRELTRGNRYCPQCAKHGYHSFFHEIIGIDQCVFHPEEDLIEHHYNGFGVCPPTFFETLETRAIDIIEPEDLRQKIDEHIHFDFSSIKLVDLIWDTAYKRACRQEWFQSSLATIKDCILRRPLNSARKVADIPYCSDESVVDQWINKYIFDCAIPRIHAKREVFCQDLELNWLLTYGIKDKERIRDEWLQRANVSPESLLYLIAHKAYSSILEQVGGISNFNLILRDIAESKFKPTDYCGYSTYAKIILLMNVTQYNCVSFFEKMLLGPIKKYPSPIFENSLSLSAPVGKCIAVSRDEKAEHGRFNIPVREAVFNDLMSHTAQIFGSLIEERKIFHAESVFDREIFFSRRFYWLPTSQYVMFQKETHTELWACDPNMEAMLNNLNRAIDAVKNNIPIPPIEPV